MDRLVKREKKIKKVAGKENEGEEEKRREFYMDL